MTDETILCSSRPESIGVRGPEQSRSGLLPPQAADYRAGVGYALGEGAKRRASKTVRGSRLMTMWSFQIRSLLAILQSRFPCSLHKSQKAYNIHPRNTPQPSRRCFPSLSRPVDHSSSSSSISSSAARAACSRSRRRTSAATFRFNVGSAYQVSTIAVQEEERRACQCLSSLLVRKVT